MRKDLRKIWNEAKSAVSADEKQKIEAFIKLKEMKISYINFWIIQTIMKEKRLEGYPYIDAKTFKAWKAEGYIVKKGEKSFASAITWVTGDSKENDNADDLYMFPKAYFLFHRSQVEKIER